MIDLYVSCADPALLSAFLSEQTNVIGPKPGLAAKPPTEDEPEHIAIGDTSLWYACVRTKTEQVLPNGITAADPATGQQIVGVWI